MRQDGPFSKASQSDSQILSVRFTRNNKVTPMVRRQKGRCALCGLYFRREDLLEVDHLLPRSRGGDHSPRNLQLIHRHCHDVKTAQDGSCAGQGAEDNSQIAEEPDEAKVSRPVLKTSRSGD